MAGKLKSRPVKGGVTCPGCGKTYPTNLSLMQHQIRPSSTCKRTVFGVGPKNPHGKPVKGDTPTPDKPKRKYQGRAKATPDPALTISYCPRCGLHLNALIIVSHGGKR